MSQIAGDVMLWAFCVVWTVLIVLIALKTKWFKGMAGRIFFVTKVGLAITAIYLAGRKLGIIPPEVAPWFYFLMFGILTCAGIAYIALLLKRNWSFWAWSKTE